MRTTPCSIMCFGQFIKLLSQPPWRQGLFGLLIEESQVRSSRWGPKIPWTNTTYWLDSPGFTHRPFFYLLGPPAQASTAQCLGSSPINCQSIKCQTDIPRGQSDGGSCSTGVLSSQVCQADNQR